MGMELGVLFAAGEGRALYRTVQAEIGAEDRRVVPDHGGTRSLQQILARIAFVTRSLESVIAGMHAKLGLAHAHIGTSKIGGLIEQGRRLSSMAFVAFSLAAHDLLDCRLSQLSWLAETTDVGAVQVFRHTQEALAGLKQAQAQLAEIERWWFVISLVGAMGVSTTDTKQVWFALRVSPLGRAFPRLVGASHDFLWHKKYGRAGLHVDQSHLDVLHSNTFLSPRCQCASQQTKRRHFRLGEFALGEPRSQLGRKAAIEFKVKFKDKDGVRVMRETPLRVLVPEWVSNSCYSRILDDVGLGRGPHGIGPRFFLSSHTAQEPPPQLQGHDRDDDRDPDDFDDDADDD